MDIRSRKNGLNSITEQIRHILVEIVSKYKEIMFQTLELLKDSKDFLEFKKLNSKISQSIYERRLKNLVNMALIYFYSLYEGFTREFFITVEIHGSHITPQEFKKIYPRFHDIIDKLIKDKYSIYLPHQIFKIIKLL